MKVSPHFLRSEFKCPCCEFAAVDIELLNVLQRVRRKFGQPVTITSANRCVKHNNQVGGADESKHLFGMAADFKVNGVSEDDVASYLEDFYEDKYGIGRYTGRTHIDVRPSPARWDRRGL